jgi:hypothetical protein
MIKAALLSMVLFSGCATVANLPPLPEPPELPVVIITNAAPDSLRVCVQVGLPSLHQQYDCISVGKLRWFLRSTWAREMLQPDRVELSSLSR